MKAKHRFFIKSFVKTDSLFIDNKDLVHQCYKVLRLLPEDFIAIFNNEDLTDYLFKIDTINKDTIKLLFIEEHNKKKSLGNIHLYQAIPNKLSKLELIVQKCSEAGVKKITFFRSHYSQDPKFLSPKKIERLEKIAIESAEQSHRNNILDLEFNFDFIIEEITCEQVYCFHTKDHNSKKLKDIDVNTKKEISLFVGPEGGFHDEEIKILEQKGTKFLYLGDNILRTESVGFGVSFFIIQNFFY